MAYAFILSAVLLVLGLISMVEGATGKNKFNHFFAGMVLFLMGLLFATIAWLIWI